jgi:hypothetical protein
MLSEVHGTNSEVSLFTQSICAERSALMALRARDDFARITAVYVVSDAPVPLSPGLLCREFLAEFISPYTPIVIASLVPAGTAAAPANHTLHSHAASGLTFIARVMRLHWLYPHPSLYQTLWRQPAALAAAKTVNAACLPFTAAADADAGAAVAGTAVTATEAAFFSAAGVSAFLQQRPLLAAAAPHASAALAAAPAAAARARALAAAAARADGGAIAAIALVGCAVLPSGAIVTALQRKALEMGHSLDAGIALYAAVQQQQLLERGEAHASNAADVSAEPGPAPILLLLSDESGALHAPSSAARALWSEHGWGGALCLLQSARCPTAPALTPVAPPAAAAAEQKGEEPATLRGLYAHIESLPPAEAAAAAALAATGTAGPPATWLPRRAPGAAVLTVTTVGALNPDCANFLAEALTANTGAAVDGAAGVRCSCP